MTGSLLRHPVAVKPSGRICASRTPVRRLTALSLCLLLLGCTGANSTADTATPGRSGVADAVAGADPADIPRGTLQWAVTEPNGITPDTAIAESDLLITDLLFDSLTALSAAGEVESSLARSWSSRENGRVWEFSLGPAVFHDGSPVTAGDVARSWEASVRAGRPQLHRVVGFDELRSGAANRLSGLDVLDAQTLAVTLTEPDVTFPMTAAHPSLGPLPEVSERSAYRGLPIGNGPFEMGEAWARGRFVRLRRVTPERSEALPLADEHDEIREVVFRTADPPTSFVRFQQGRVDVAPVPGGELADAVDLFGMAEDGSAESGVHTDPRPGLVYLGFDLTEPPFDHVDVRAALSMAIDRDVLAEELAEGNVTAARSLVPPAIPGYESEACAACRHDPDRARDIFAQHGVTELELTYEGDPGEQLLVDRLRADLADVGVELSARPLTFGELLVELSGDVPQLYTFGWMTEVPSAHAAVAPLVSGAPLPGANVNYGGYRDDEVDALLAQAGASHHRARRERLVRAAEDVALGRDQAVVPLYTTNARTAVADDVEGLTLSAFGATTLDGVRLR